MCAPSSMRVHLTLHNTRVQSASTMSLQIRQSIPGTEMHSQCDSTSSAEVPVRAYSKTSIQAHQQGKLPC